MSKVPHKCAVSLCVFLFVEDPYLDPQVPWCGATGNGQHYPFSALL